MMKTNQLPPLSPDAAAHQAQVLKHIREKISKQGPISFHDFMQIALTAEGLGYYVAGARKFGAEGDFVTAPEISPLFSQCLARQCAEILSQLPGADLLEFGPGSGRMAKDLLLALEKLNVLPTQYYLLEISPDLRERQKALFLAEIPHLMPRLVWLDRLPEKFRGVILANEVLDAMPVHLFRIHHGTQEAYVDWQQDQLVWHYQPSTHLRLNQAITPLQLAEGYQSEINLSIAPWIKSLSKLLIEGVTLILDYGFPRREYYHPDRQMGTLMCHTQQIAHDNPLIRVGLQDITAHVDFTEIAESADQAGLSLSGYTTQAHFLLNCGLLELVQTSLAAAESMTQSQQIKRLTLDSEMGELFKVMALAKGWTQPLLGFQHFDRRHSL